LYAGIDVGNVTGATGYSFSRASQGYYQNADGTLTLFGHNLCLHSQALDNAAWALTTATRATAVSDPDGGTTAITLTATSNNGQILQTVGGSAGTGTNYTVSLYLRRRTGTGDVWIFNPNAGGITTVTLTSSWQRFSVTGVGAAATNSVGVRLATTGDAIDVAFAQLEVGSSASPYIPTTSAAVSALRRGDRGVLIEGSRTNLLLQSQTFATTWTAQRTTITENTIAAPDGTTTADTVLETVDSGSHGVFQAITKAASSITYALSCHIKPNGRNWAILQLDSAGETNRVRVWFDLTGSGVVGSNVALGTGFSFVSASIQALANGWYRCVAVITGDTNTAYTSHVRPATADTTVSYTGDITKGLYIWGAQLEAASFPSSYIPTTSASVTRAADVLTYTAGVTYPIQLWSEFERAVDTGDVEKQISLWLNLSNNAFLEIGPTDLATAAVTAGGSTVFSESIAGAVAIGTVTKLASRVALNDMRAAKGGTLSALDSSAALPSNPTTLTIGARTDGIQSSFGYTRRIAVIQGAGTDANLVSMTS
jgi:hypothetical protein